jgi:hypothetical protein
VTRNPQPAHSLFFLIAIHNLLIHYFFLSQSTTCSFIIFSYRFPRMLFSYRNPQPAHSLFFLIAVHERFPGLTASVGVRGEYLLHQMLR